MIDENLAKIRQYEKEEILRKRDELVSRSLSRSDINVNDYYILKRVRTIDISKIKSQILIYLGVYLVFRLLVWIYDIYTGDLEYVVSELFGIMAGMFIMALVCLSLTKGKFYYEFDHDKIRSKLDVSGVEKYIDLKDVGDANDDKSTN